MQQTIINTIITIIITALISSTITYARTSKKSAISLKEGVLSLLRLMIIQQHDKYVEQYYCSITDKEIIDKAYSAYHNLGGNGAITTYYNEIMALPNRKDV